MYTNNGTGLRYVCSRAAAEYGAPLCQSFVGRPLDTLVARLPVAGKKACFVIGHLLMLYVCWLMLKGGWQQTVIALGSTSAVMEVSMAWFTVSGVVFAVLASLFIILELWKLVSGQIGETDLIGVTESEDKAHET